MGNVRAFDWLCIIFPVYPAYPVGVSNGRHMVLGIQSNS